MLRSALVAAFSAALAFGALAGHAGAKGAVAQDSSWRVQAAAAAGAGDSSWVIVADDAPGDSSWVAPADSSWAVQS